MIVCQNGRLDGCQTNVSIISTNAHAANAHNKLETAAARSRANHQTKLKSLFEPVKQPIANLNEFAITLKKNTLG